MRRCCAPSVSPFHVGSCPEAPAWLRPTRPDSPGNPVTPRSPDPVAKILDESEPFSENERYFYRGRPRASRIPSLGDPVPLRSANWSRWHGRKPDHNQGPCAPEVVAVGFRPAVSGGGARGGELVA